MWYSYYGNGFTARDWPQSYRQNNANNIAYYFRQQGWTLNAICAMLGNMQVESYINPAQWQHGIAVGSINTGFGLVQWTPRTKYTDWATSYGENWQTNFDFQLTRIQWELENDQQWQPVLWHGMTFREFAQSTDSVYTLTEAFLRAYENPADPSASLSIRQSNSAYWYEYFTGNPPTPPTPGPTPGSSNKFKLMFYLKPKWKRGIY